HRLGQLDELRRHGPHGLAHRGRRRLAHHRSLLSLDSALRPGRHPIPRRLSRRRARQRAGRALRHKSRRDLPGSQPSQGARWGCHVHFGIFDHMEQRGTPLHQLYAERLDYLGRADEAGFWAYFKSEHHLTPLDAAPCQSVFLAAAAQRTRRIRLVPLVYLLPFHHPVRLVEEISMLDHLCTGRLEVGVGRGIAPPEHDMWGLDPATSRERAEEALEVVLRGLTSDRLDHEGRFYTFRDVPMELHPYQQPYPPLWYPGTLEIAARRGFHTVVGGTVAHVAKLVARYRAAAEAHRRDPGRVNPHVANPIVAGATRVFVARTDAAAERRARRAWAAYTRNITSCGGGPACPSRTCPATLRLAVTSSGPSPWARPWWGHRGASGTTWLPTPRAAGPTTSWCPSPGATSPTTRSCAPSTSSSSTPWPRRPRAELMPLDGAGGAPSPDATSGAPGGWGAARKMRRGGIGAGTTVVLG
ncbi:MAG: LLM class flavin-dependent oxidoreductase, partial [Acidimicrobiia bacterium]|nr:LLM class flavin-dependent oxidoreductase [Acidimicrobiia bacterium]